MYLHCVQQNLALFGGAISALDPYSQRDPVCNSLFCIPTVF